MAESQRSELLELETTLGYLVSEQMREKVLLFPQKTPELVVKMEQVVLSRHFLNFTLVLTNFRQQKFFGKNEL